MAWTAQESWTSFAFGYSYLRQLSIALEVNLQGCIIFEAEHTSLAQVLCLHD